MQQQEQQSRTVSPIKQRRPSCKLPVFLSGRHLGEKGSSEQLQTTLPAVSPANSVSVSTPLQSLLAPTLNDIVKTDSIENKNSIKEGQLTCNDDTKERIYIDSLCAYDVLCGRGGRSNNHTGNKRYRQVVGNIKFMYQQCPAKTIKTDLSKAIVEHCCSYGARFVKKDEVVGKYYVLGKAEARKKASQALRELKALKWSA